MKEAEENQKEETRRKSKAFRTSFKSNVKDQRRTSLEMQIDRDIIQKNIHREQQALLPSGDGLEILPESSEMNNTLLTTLVADLDYNKDMTKRGHYDSKWQLSAEVKEEKYDYNSDRSGDISEVFLRRALSKSTGGAMLVLNDGYHLRSYLDSSTGQIQLTPRIKAKVEGEGEGARSSGEVPLLPAEQEAGPRSATTSPSRGNDGALVSPGRDGTDGEGREASVLSPRGDISTLVSNADAQPTHSLCDCVFLVGPDKEEVEAMVVKYLSSAGLDNGDSYKETMPSGGGGARDRTMSSGRARTASSSSSASNSSFTSGLPTQPQTKTLEPRLLYHTQLHPDLEAELVPFFCFPGGANVTMRPPSAAPSGAGGSGGTPNTPKVGMALQSPSMTFRRKSVMGLNQGPQAGFMATRPSSNVRCFSFLLSSHFSTQYGVCFVFQRTYHYRDKTGRFNGVSLSVSVDYCVCVVTKVPFLSFFFHTLAQFEALGGLDHHVSGFSAPAASPLSTGVGVAGVALSAPGTPTTGTSQPVYVLPALDDMFHAQEEGMPLQGDLWLLNDLASRLAATTVPLYPHLVDDYEAFFSAAESRDAEDMGLPHSREHSPPGGRAGTRLRAQSGSSVSSLNSTGGGVKASSRATAFAPLLLTVLVRQQRRLDLTLDRDTVWRAFAGHMEPLVASSVDGALTLGQGYGGLSSSPVRKDKDQDSDKRNRRGKLARVSQYLSSIAADRDLEGGQHVLCWALPILLRHVPLDQLLMALGCAVNEMKIVVLSEDTTVLSGCVLALWRLLRPLKWAGNIIVTLPDFLVELLESPSFFLIGMKSLPPDFSLSQGLIVIDAQERMVNLHPADVVVSHTLQVPLHARLLSALKPHAEGIMQAYRSCRREARQREREQRLAEHAQLGLGITSPGAGIISPDPRSPLMSPKPLDKGVVGSPDPRPPMPPAPFIGHGRPAVHATMNAYGNTGPRQPGSSFVPMPCDLDHSSSTGRALGAAVAGFYSVMSHHLQTLLNTAVRQEEERSKRDRRRKQRQEEEAEGVSSVQDRGKKGIRAGINRALQSIRPKEEEKGKEKDRDRDRDRDSQGSSGEKESGEEMETNRSTGTAGAMSPAPSELGSAAGANAEGAIASVDTATSKQTESGGTRLRTRTGSEGYSSAGGSSVDGDRRESTESKGGGSGALARSPSLSPSRRLKESRDAEKEREIEKEKAATFSTKDIGESGIVFLRQLLRTQAFSNYLFDRTQRGAARKVSEVRQQYKAQLAAHKERLEREAAELQTGGTDEGADAGGSILDQMTAGNPLRAGSGLREATLKSLFTIAITGALPIDDGRVKELQASLEGLEKRIERDYRRKYEGSMDGVHRAPSLEDLPGEELSPSIVALPPSGQEISDVPEVGDDRGILWCNGRCGGMADTPSCTVMCVVLWSKRLQRAKSALGVQSLIRKYHAGSGAGAYPQVLGHYHPREKVLGGLSVPGGRTVSVRVKSVPTRHPRETDAQFQLRLREAGLANNSLQATALAASMTTTVAQGPSEAGLSSSYTTNSDLISRAYGRKDLPVDPTTRAKVLVLRLMRRQSLLLSYERECHRLGVAPGATSRTRTQPEKDKPKDQSMGKSREIDGDKRGGAQANKTRKRPPIHAIEALAAYHSDRHRTTQRRRCALALRTLIPFMRHALDVVRRTLLLKAFGRLQIRRWLRCLDAYKDGSGFKQVRTHFRSVKKELLHLTRKDSKAGGVSFFAESPRDGLRGQSSSFDSDLDTEERADVDEDEEEQARERENERRRSRVQTIRDQMGAYFTPTHSSSTAAAVGSLEDGTERLGTRGSPYDSDGERRSLSRQSSFPSMPNSGRVSIDPDSPPAPASPLSASPKEEDGSLLGGKERDVSSDDNKKDQEAARDDKSSPADSDASAQQDRRSDAEADKNDEQMDEESDDVSPGASGQTKETGKGKIKKSAPANEGGLTLRIEIDNSPSTASNTTNDNHPGSGLPSPAISPVGAGRLSVPLTGFSSSDLSPNSSDRGGPSPAPPVSVTISPKTKRGGRREREPGKERGTDKDDRRGKEKEKEKEQVKGKGSTKSVKSIPSMSSITTATTGRGSDPRGADASSKTLKSVSPHAKVEPNPLETTPTPSPRSRRERNWSDDVPASLEESEALTPQALRKLDGKEEGAGGADGDEALIYEDSPVAKAPRSGSVSVSGRVRGRIDSVDSVSGSMRVLTHSRLDETSQRLLRALGPAANDELTSQQLSMVVGMYSLLREGIAVRKHSSKAGPQKRFLFCDVNLSVLYWRLPSSSARLPDREEEELVLRAHTKSKATAAASSSFRSSYESGGRLSIVGGESERSSTTSSSSSSWSLFGSADKDRMLVLRDVSEVSTEVGGSPILKKAVDRGHVQRAGKRRENGQPQYTDQAGNKVGLVSVAGRTRNLVFDMEQERWGELFHAMQVLVNYFRSQRELEQGLEIDLSELI